ncbi:MAG: dioxygenase [Dehalococcoidia bacterium]|nr:dioxygenase [Dehalococcoidia bacterium]
MTQHPQTPAPSLIPAVFVGVGGPRQMDDVVWCGELEEWADAMPRPKAILVFSAHWLRYPLTTGATHPVALEYDYYGFPQHYYQVQYPAPPAPDLAGRLAGLLGDFVPIEGSQRGLDHGVFIGLKGMYPDADVPVLQASIPTLDPESLFELGRRLAPLRPEGVMVMGAGLLTHSQESPTANAEFDAWVAETLERGDVDALLRYQEIAPGVAQALPTQEHFVPLLVAYGAAYDGGAAVATGVSGFTTGGGSKRSLQFG